MKSVVAVCSFPGSYDVERNLALHEAYMREAAAEGVEFLVFPECSLQGYPRVYLAEDEEAMIDDVSGSAESLNGPRVQRIEALSRELNLSVIFGMTERGSRPGVAYNASLLVTPDGGVMGTYRKVHLAIQEKVFWRPGSDWPVFDTVLGNVGMMICFDKAWPEAARELTLRGADVLVMPTAWWLYDPTAGENDVWVDHYILFERTRAVENNRWFLSSNLVGDIGGRHFFGISQIIDPRGRIVATTGYDNPGLAIAEIDVAGGIQDAYKLNSGAHLIRDRRPDTYAVLGGRLDIEIDG